MNSAKFQDTKSTHKNQLQWTIQKDNSIYNSTKRILRNKCNPESQSRWWWSFETRDVVVIQHCECTKCCLTVHFKMVNHVLSRQYPACLLSLSSQHFTFRIFQWTPTYSWPRFYPLAFYYSLLLSHNYPSFHQAKMHFKDTVIINTLQP